MNSEIKIYIYIFLSIDTLLWADGKLLSMLSTYSKCMYAFLVWVIGIF